MIIKRCVICDKTYEAELDRSDNVTCSVACRSKLHRERRKAKAARNARLLSHKQESMMLWLSRNVPEAAHNLRKIREIHGKEAFTLASAALTELGKYQKNSNQSS
ncbi:MAG: hypothetical protein AAFQ07_12965 [Chloroflexota bacterium]